MERNDQKMQNNKNCCNLTDVNKSQTEYSKTNAQELEWIDCHIPSSWKEAAVSWRMSIQDFSRIGMEILYEREDDPSYNYETLIPIFNPYARLDPHTEEYLKKNFKSEEEYQNAIKQLEKQHPKFTVAR